jgi:methyl-accepting chemotaxis protein
MLVYRYPAINATWEERNWLKDYPEFEEALKGREIAATVYAPFEVKNRLVGFTPVASIGWAASAGRTEEEVISPILFSIANNALLFLSVSLAAFFIALAVSRKITNPVRALRAHALALGRGEKPEPVGISDELELQDLADTFHAMAEKVRAREMELRASEESLR